jgi:hypothetical protein
VLLRRVDEGVIAITQSAHAWVSRLMAQAWGGQDFAAPALFQKVCLAAALHDCGWLVRETAPQLDAATGWPLDFWRVPATLHTMMWQEGLIMSKL